MQGQSDTNGQVAYRDSTNNKYVEFPTSGNSEQFKIQSGIDFPIALANRTSNSNRLTSAFNNQPDDHRMMTVQIFLNVDFDFGNGTELLRHTEQYPPTQMTIDSMIQTAVIDFNEMLEAKNSPHRINPNVKIWNLCMAKKTGRPKQDLPALDRDNLLSESGSIDMFTLDSKDANKLIYADSSIWIRYKRREENGGDDDYDSDYNTDDEENGKKQESPKQQLNQKNSTMTANAKAVSTNASINDSSRISVSQVAKKSELISSVPRKQKSRQSDGAGSCAGLCSFSK